MIIGQDLRDWIGDRERQRRTQRAINAFAEAWNHGPWNRRFAAAMAALPAPTAADVAAAVQALFHEDGWAAALIDDLAEALQSDPYFEPPFRYFNSDVHGGLLVYEDEHVAVAAGVTHVADLAAKKRGKRDATSIGFTGELSLIKFVKAGGAVISLWEAPTIGDDFSAAAAGRCRRSSERHLKDGDVVVLDGRRAAFVIEHARSNLVVLQATVKHERAPLAVEYDSATGEYVGCSAADDSASRIQMIASLLGRIDCAGAVPVLAGFLDHPSFFVRWHVMRELLGLDAEAALPHLKRMAARDPHRETRRAARQVLDRIERGDLLSEAA